MKTQKPYALAISYDHLGEVFGLSIDSPSDFPGVEISLLRSNEGINLERLERNLREYFKTTEKMPDYVAGALAANVMRAYERVQIIERLRDLTEQLV
jgi:hypothetical protein